MARAWLLIIVAALLLASCTKAPSKIVSLPEVQEEPVSEPKPLEVPVSNELVAKELGMGASESLEYGGKLFKVMSLARDSGVLVDIDGIRGNLVETKNYEIINGLKITLLKFDYSNLDKPKADIILEEFKLAENEYLVYSDKPLDVSNVKIKLKEVGSDYIYVEVGPGSAEKILLNSEKGFNGIRIKLLKPFFKDISRQPYAWVKVVS